MALSLFSLRCRLRAGVCAGVTAGAVAGLCLGAVLAPVPAAAQFGWIFGDEDPPPRPPGNVPGRGNVPMQGAPFEPASPQPLSPPTVIVPQDEAPVQRPSRPEARLPAPRSGIGGVESQPLAPPPGSPAAPVTEQAAQPPLRTLPGLPDGQRQPRPAPGETPNQDTPPPSTPPTERVVVQAPGPHVENPGAIFAGLDKITGRITSFDVALGETVQFGALQVTARACYTRPPTETPNTDAFIEVDEVTLKGDVRRIYTGWMYAASPGLHAVEHPIYDIWLTDCKKPVQAVADTAAEKPKEQAKPAAAPRRAAPPPARPRAQQPPPAPPAALRGAVAPRF